MTNKKAKHQTLLMVRASEVLDETLSDLALSATSTSSLLSRQLEDADDIISASINVRLGGCADPTVIAGSIIDHHFIHRKASVVGNVRLEAYGGLGGGFLSSFGRRQSMSLLDGDSDLDTMMGSILVIPIIIIISDQF